MVGLLANRALAWLVLGGGGLAVILMLYTGALHKGARNESAKWQKAVDNRVQDVRDLNFRLNQGTLSTDADLRRREDEIAKHWQSAQQPAAPAGGEK